MIDLRSKVFASLDAATENGYDMTVDASLIAADLCMCDATYEGVSDDGMIEIHGYVIEWQKDKKDG